MKLFAIKIKEFDSCGTDTVFHPSFIIAGTSVMDAEKRAELQIPAIKTECTRVFSTKVVGDIDREISIKMYHFDIDALVDADFNFDNYDPETDDFDADNFRFVKVSAIDGRHDFETHLCTINGTDWYFFRTN